MERITTKPKSRLMPNLPAIKRKIMNDIDEVEPRIFISSRLTSTKICLLKSLGITHILIWASDIEEKYPDSFTYKTISMEDNREENISKHFVTAFDFIKEALEKNTINNVLVHCWAGKSRSPTIVASYLIKQYKISAHIALKIINKRRDIRPNHGFKKQLFEHQIEITGLRVDEDKLY